MKSISGFMLSDVLGWKIKGEFPDVKKSIIVFAPHTSYHDALYGKLSKFGIETLSNLYYQATGKIVKYVLLAELDHLSKFSKTSTLSATKQYIKEGQEIALTAFNNFNLISKIIKKNIAKL
jgi:hypothetical protein